MYKHTHIYLYMFIYIYGYVYIWTIDMHYLCMAPASILQELFARKCEQTTLAFYLTCNNLNWTPIFPIALYIWQSICRKLNECTYVVPSKSKVNVMPVQKTASRYLFVQFENEGWDSLWSFFICQIF